MEKMSKEDKYAASEEVKCQPEKDTMYGLPFIPECEVIGEVTEEGCDEIFRRCLKNPGHKNFIPVLAFKKEHLPVNLQTDEMMKQIKDRCHRTVKLAIKYTSLNRPDTYPNGKSSYPYKNLKGSRWHTRMGTGYIIDTLLKFNIFRKETPCPCHLCRDSQNPKIGFIEVDVATAAHVVFDSFEARETVVELFYDDPDNKDGVKRLYGYKLKVDFHNDGYQRQKAYNDVVIIKCATHDQEVMDLLPAMDQTITGSMKRLPIGASSGVVISHPHGCSKYISVGNFVQYNCPLPVDYQDGSHFDIGPGTRYRFTKNCPVPRMASFQRFTQVCTFFENPYIMNEEMTLTLPANSTYLFQFLDVNGPWITFPSGTRLTIPGRKHSFILLPGMLEFDLKGTRNTMYPPKYVDFATIFNCEQPLYVTYDINTCPGSSGAPVMISPDGRGWTTHFGALPDGTNRSGISSHTFDHDLDPISYYNTQVGNVVHGCPSQ